MKPELTDGELLAAMRDAERRGTGWVRILRITTGVSGNFRVSRIDPTLVVVLDDPTVYLDQLRALVLSLPCPTCGAQTEHVERGVEVQQPCRTSSGRRTTFHVTRSEPVYTAWRLGHRDGLIDAFRRLTDDWDTPAAELLSKNGARW